MLAKIKNRSKRLKKRFVILRKRTKKTWERWKDYGQRMKIQTTPQSTLSYFILNIVNHCNLRCQCCDHFACIADTHCVSLESIRHDLRRLDEILEHQPQRIGVMGGEPLLHPDLLEILRMTREIFSQSRIELTTNGILLLQQGQDFWDCCRDQHIIIKATRYPIAVDYDEIQRMAEGQEVDFEFYGSTGEQLKFSYKKIFDLTGSQRQKTSFAYCTQANKNVFLMEGKFYPCTIAACHVQFNQKFGTELQRSEQDYLVLDEVKSEGELFAFFARPVPFCRYCDTRARIKRIPWATSKGSIHEWL